MSTRPPCTGHCGQGLHVCLSALWVSTAPLSIRTARWIQPWRCQQLGQLHSRLHLRHRNAHLLHLGHHVLAQYVPPLSASSPPSAIGMPLRCLVLAYTLQTLAADHPVYQTTFEFRTFWLQSKCSEEPRIAERTSDNPFVFLSLDRHMCSPEMLQTVLQTPVPFLIDGILFFHGEGFYLPGEASPLALWLLPHQIPEVLGIEIGELPEPIPPKPLFDVAPSPFAAAAATPGGLAPPSLPNPFASGAAHGGNPFAK
eukprot:m.70962 g.70962  ORF g.70962 m.70962 type:complete len:255 (+) comp7907_c0_seq3:576-1340(+)